MSESTATAPAPPSAPANPAVSLERVQRYSLPMGVLAFAEGRDPSQLFAACLDGVYQLDLSTGTHQRLYQHDSYVSGVVLDPQRPVVISAGYDGQLIWYDLERRSVFRRVIAHDFWSWQMAISPDGQRLASVTGQYRVGGEQYEPAPEREPSVRIFDVGTGKLQASYSHVPSVQAVAFSPDSQHVAAANLMGQIRVWRVQTGELAADWRTDGFTGWGVIKSHCFIGGVFALRFSPDGTQILAAGMGPMKDPMAGNGRQLWQRFVWQQSPVERLDETRANESGEGLMEALAYHPRLPLFLMGGRLRGGDWNAALFSTHDGARLHHINSGYRMTSAQFADDGTQLFVAGADRQKPPENGELPPFGLIESYRVIVA